MIHDSLIVFEVAVAILAAVPLLRLVADLTLRQSAWRIHAAITVGVLSWFVLVAVVATYSSQLLFLLTIPAGAFLTVTLWRDRASYGRTRGLPPGSMCPFAGLKGITQRQFYLEQAKRCGPIFKLAQLSARVICVVGSQRAQKLLREHQDAIGPAPLFFSRQISGGFVRHMDAETYSLYGNLLRKAFAKDVADAAIGVTRAATELELKRIVDDCQLTRSNDVRLKEYLDRIAFSSLAYAFFGILPSTDEESRFAKLYSILSEHDLGRPLDSRQIETLAALRLFMFEQTERLHSSKNEDAPNCALSALRRSAPNMPDATCIDNLMFIFRIAQGNVSDLLCWIWATLSTNPVWVDRLRATKNATAEEQTDDLDRVIMETLRMAQSEYLYRSLKEDIVYEGHLLPKGWLLRIGVWEGHRDPQAFSDPDRFNPDRFAGSSQPDYMPFGFGQHACTGMPLTMMICRSVLDILTQGYEWRATGVDSLEHDFRFWTHWRPGTRFRVRLSPRVTT